MGGPTKSLNNDQFLVFISNTLSLWSDNAEEPHIPAVQSHHPPGEDEYAQVMHNGHSQDNNQQQTGDQNWSGILPEHGLCARALYDYQACTYQHLCSMK